MVDRPPASSIRNMSREDLQRRVAWVSLAWKAWCKQGGFGRQSDGSCPDHLMRFERVQQIGNLTRCQARLQLALQIALSSQENILSGMLVDTHWLMGEGSTALLGRCLACGQSWPPPSQCSSDTPTSETRHGCQTTSVLVHSVAHLHSPPSDVLAVRSAHRPWLPCGKLGCPIVHRNHDARIVLA